MKTHRERAEAAIHSSKLDHFCGEEGCEWLADAVARETFPAEVLTALLKAKDNIARRFGRPGTNNVDRELLEEIEAALALYDQEPES